MKKNIYLDNAATTRLHPDVLTAMMPYFCDEYANPSAGYLMSGNAARAVAAARTQCARLIGAAPEEIYFTGGGSESDNWALRGCAKKSAKKGRHIITGAIEHHAVLNTCRALEREGFAVTYLTPDSTGIIRPESVAEAVRPDTFLISIMTANNEVGTIEPVKAIGRIARRNGIIFHTDAVQAYGHIPINVNEAMIDMLSVSAHKLYGPKGCGLLYIRNTVAIEPLIYGGSQENGLRAGTSNVPGIVGLGKASEIAMRTMNSSTQRLLKLRTHLIKRISLAIPDAILTGHPTMRLPNNVSFCFPGTESSTVLSRLDAKGICASAGSACSTGAAGPSHVLLAMGIEPDIAGSSLRLTLSVENTIEELDYVVEVLRDIINPTPRQNAQSRTK